MYLYYELILYLSNGEEAIWKKINILVFGLILKSLAELEGRSINGEVLYLIRQAIAQHEKDHGILNK